MNEIRPWGQWVDKQWSGFWKWAGNNRYWIVSIFVSVASAPGDAGYISRYINPVFAYMWNFAVDAATEMAMYAFVLIWRKQLAKWRKILSPLLLLSHFAMFYFAVVFAHAEFELQLPGQLPYLYWSLAAFGPAGLTTLAISQALMETRTKAAKGDTKPAPLREPSKTEKVRVFAKFAGNGTELTTDSWNAALQKAGYTPDKPSTARYWVDKAQPERVKAGEQ